MEEDKRARLVVLALAVLIGAGLTSIPVLGTSATPNGIVTVCPSGPPACDYQTIQKGVDAASAGDTILISSGVYTEQVVLKSGVTLSSSDGPEATTITAVEGPVVTATHVTSAVIQGITISGRGIVSVSVGVQASDADLTLANCVVENLYGADGSEASPDGKDATAIHFTGTGNLIITGSVIQNIGGGNPLEEADADGGSVTGIWVDGTAQVTITATTVRSLKGGDAGYSWGSTYWCDGAGGHVLAIDTSGAHLTVSDSQLTDLVGGGPCEAVACSGSNGGTVSGIRASGGAVVLRDNTFTNFSVWDGGQSSVIYTSQTAGTYLERNVVDFSSAVRETANMQTLRPRSPYCSPPWSSEIAITSDDDDFLYMYDNSIQSLSGIGYGGAVGVRAQGTTDVRLVRNSIFHITGGSAGPKAIGISVRDASTVTIDANTLSEIHGGNAPSQYYYLFAGVEGGSAVGIDLYVFREEPTDSRLAESVPRGATVTNNTIWSLSGGRGTDMDTEGYAGRDGGDAIALRVAGGKIHVWNNVCYQTIAGLGGIGNPVGQPGVAVGLDVMGSTDVSAANNVLMDHDVGILATDPSTLSLMYNNLWQNEADYSGTLPGTRDLRVDPGFVNVGSGDFHLKAGSSLVDAGTNWGAPGIDFEGQPRPMDGDGDGASAVDIGADEYWAGDILAFKSVDRSIAAPGDVLTYQVTLVNPGVGSDFGIVLTDALPAGVTYVTGTLQGTAGSWGAASGVITWAATVLAGDKVALTFSAKVDGALVEPRALVNEALLDDRTGVVRTLHATTLVNATRCYLPFIRLDGTFR